MTLGVRLGAELLEQRIEQAGLDVGEDLAQLGGQIRGHAQAAPHGEFGASLRYASDLPLACARLA